MNSTTLQAAVRPYPGLRPFRRHEAHLFFGRDEQVVSMLTKLEESRLLVVVGGSGSGKSSMVRAGLLPTLEEGYLFSAGPDWQFVVMKPGNAPFRELARALHTGTGRAEPHAADVAFTEAILRSGRHGFTDALDDAGGAGTKPVLLLVDQFEELFRFRHETDDAADEVQPRYERRNDAAAFVKLLLSAFRDPVRPVYVLLTMRSDFIGDCEAFDGLPQSVSDHQFLAPRATREQIRAAIEKPLLLFDASAEPRLVNQILNDTGNQLDNLPLMQHALMRVWFEAKERAGDSQPIRLTYEDYRRVGGFKSALSRHADEALGELSPEEQRIARHLFVSLSDQQEGGQTVRRDTTLAEVAASAGVEPEAVKPVVLAFQRADRSFVISSPEGELGPETVLDISHEALLRQWGTLREWIAAEATAATEYRWLIDNARRKGQGSTQTVEWLSDVDLQRAAEFWKRRPTAAWAARYGGDFEAARRYLEGSRDAKVDRIRAEAEQAEAERRRVRANYIAGGVVIALLLALFGVSGYSFIQARNARLELQATTDPLVAADLIQEVMEAKAWKAPTEWLRSADEVLIRMTRAGNKENAQLIADLDECRGEFVENQKVFQRVINEGMEGLERLDDDPKSGLPEFLLEGSGQEPLGRPGDYTIKPETGLVFVLLPGGRFRMGSDLLENERPPHTVSLPPFLISKYELTRAQWGKLSGSEAAAVRAIQPASGHEWSDCLEVLLDHQLDLPTEEQWEYACRAGSAGLWSCDEADIDDVAHWNSNTARSVGELEPNGFGLHDVHGNVYEWCDDLFGDKAYQEKAADKAYGTTRAEASEAVKHSVRGGSYDVGRARDAIRSAFRMGIKPGRSGAEIGLRPIMNIK